MSTFTPEHRQQMIDSYARISFYGERRGAEDFTYYSELLASDLEELGESQGQYAERFVSHVMDIYHRQANCTSAFIVGPAKYNVRQHEKRWDSRDRAYDHFQHWRERYFKRVNRVRTPSPEDEIESAVADIDKLLRYQAVAKETNKIIRKYKIDRDYMVGFEKSQNERDCSIALLFLYEYDENPEARVNSILKADCFGNRGYASFELTSISTKIRARRKKIEAMKVRIERKKDFEDIKFQGGYATIENDRVVIYHDEKPERSVIQAIKGRGFRWSPRFKCWCRKHTGNAIYDLNDLVTNHFGGKLA